MPKCCTNRGTGGIGGVSEGCPGRRLAPAERQGAAVGLGLFPPEPARNLMSSQDAKWCNGSHLGPWELPGAAGASRQEGMLGTWCDRSHWGPQELTALAAAGKSGAGLGPGFPAAGWEPYHGSRLWARVLRGAAGAGRRWAEPGAWVPGSPQGATWGRGGLESGFLVKSGAHFTLLQPERYVSLFLSCGALTWGVVVAQPHSGCLVFFLCFVKCCNPSPVIFGYYLWRYFPAWLFKMLIFFGRRAVTNSCATISLTSSAAPKSC